MKERAVYPSLPAGGGVFGSSKKNIRKYEDEIALALQHTMLKVGTGNDEIEVRSVLRKFCPAKTKPDTV